MTAHSQLSKGTQKAPIATQRDWWDDFTEYLPTALDRLKNSGIGYWEAGQIYGKV